MNGVVVTPLRRIEDDRGGVWHMLKNTDSVFEQFGEIYFSTIYPQAIKGWHIHQELTINYACVAGMIKVVLYDSRPESPTHGEVAEYFLGDYNYVLLNIPPLITVGMQGLGTTLSVVANCATLPHDPKEMLRIDPQTSDIPYTWGHGN